MFRTRSAKLPHETRIEVERECASEGLFDFQSQTSQVLLSSTVVYTDSNLLILFLFIQVWEFASSGQSYSCWPYFY